MIDPPEQYGTRPRRSIAGVLIVLAVAFLLGALLTAWAVRRWDRVAALLHPVTVVQPAAALVPPRPIILPAPAGQQPTDPALVERIDGIENRLQAIDARAAAATGDADRAEGLLVAFAARRVLDRGQPLGYLEGMLRERFGGRDAPAVALVIAASQRPVLLAQLQDGLAQIEPTLVTERSGESWWTGIRREIGSLFVVRRADTPSAAPLDRFARATHALEQGQVDAAAAEVARMPGAPRAGEWLGKARRYVLARNALDRLETAALLTPSTPAPAIEPTETAPD